MRNKLTMLCNVMLFILSCGVFACAQSSTAEEYKFEAGAQFSVLNSRIPEVIDFSRIVCITFPCLAGDILIRSSREMQPGLGGRIGYNLTNHVTLEAEMNFFPGAGSYTTPANFRGGHKTEGLFGAKVGKRFDKVGIFAKARPGFLYASKGDLRQNPNTGCITIVPIPAGCFETTSKTSFALDLGGVVEFYPTTRTIIRLDAGDTMVRLSDRLVSGDVAPNPPFLPSPFATIARVPAETSHNLQWTVGVGFRF